MGRVMGKVFIQTYGCQMNEYDTDKMFELLGTQNYTPASTMDEADLVLLNTCSVRDKAEQKVYSELGRMRRLKKQNPNVKIGVGGCVAQQEGVKILKRAENVDFVFGTDNLFELPEILKETEKGARPVQINRLAPRQKVRDFIPDFSTSASNLPALKAHLAITKGCNNYCSFCVVPLTRGTEVSRSPQNILEEATRLCDNGTREICLLGQNVNSYHANGVDFVELLQQLDGIKNLERIRFTSPHPKDFHPKLADAMASLPSVCEQLHLPLQSGSNEVLKRMRRWYTTQTYLEKVEMFRSRMPEGTISTDLIVGYPGETEEDFQKTLEMMQEVRFDLIYAFKFSIRPGTRAAEEENQLSDQIKSERLRILLETHEGILREKQELMVGSRQEVLVEGPHPRETGNMSGRTRGNHSVMVRGTEGLSGSLLPVKITGFRTYLLEAEAA